MHSGLCLGKQTGDKTGVSTYESNCWEGPETSASCQGIMVWEMRSWAMMAETAEAQVVLPSPCLHQTDPPLMPREQVVVVLVRYWLSHSWWCQKTWMELIGRMVLQSFWSFQHHKALPMHGNHYKQHLWVFSPWQIVSDASGLAIQGL